MKTSITQSCEHAWNEILPDENGKDQVVNQIRLVQAGEVIEDLPDRPAQRLIDLGFAELVS